MFKKKKNLNNGQKSEEKATTLLDYADLKRPKYKAIYCVSMTFLIAFSLVCIFPIIWYMLLGFKSVKEIYAIPPTLFPKSINVDSVAKVWRLSNAWHLLGNTLMLVVGKWATTIVINGLAGYFLSKIRSKGYEVFNKIVFWTMLMPGIGSVPLYAFFADVPYIHINLIGQIWPLFFMTVSSFNIILFRNFFNGIPTDYMEAARIDGLSDTGIFFRIMIPLAKPVIAVVSIGAILGAWSDFYWPMLMLDNTDLKPMAVYLYQVTRQSGGLLKDNEQILLTALTLIPPFVIFAFFSKRIMGGMNMSGVKG